MKQLVNLLLKHPEAFVPTDVPCCLRLFLDPDFISGSPDCASVSRGVVERTQSHRSETGVHLTAAELVEPSASRRHSDARRPGSLSRKSLPR